MLIAETKVHPLWHTALLPALFLVSCLSMGFGAVVALVTILKLTWNGQHDSRLLAQLSKVNAGSSSSTWRSGSGTSPGAASSATSGRLLHRPVPRRAGALPRPGGPVPRPRGAGGTAAGSFGAALLAVLAGARTAWTRT